jgi:RNA polymerase sigma-70 factor (ECF subfamily)
MTTLDFNKQLLSYENPLKYFALKLTADNEDAEDLLQETLLKALKYKDKFKEKTNLKAWLYTIMKNTFINGYRSKTRRKTFTSSTEIDVQSNHLENQDDDENQFIVKELEDAINKMEDKQKVPIQMFIDGYHYKEIAKELDLNIGTVKSRIFFARKHLKSKFKNDFSYFKQS